MHSATKYLGGHSDVVGGFVALDDDELAERLRFTQNAAGAVPAPFDCYLVLRGVKTLAVRMDRHCDERPRRRRPARRATPRSTACCTRSSPTTPATPRPPSRCATSAAWSASRCAAARRPRCEVVRHTELFTLAESLGAVESLIEHPGRMTHASAAGSPLEVPDSLVRLSVGLESADDLVADLEQALDRI